jgi:hypothetical protein
MIMFVFMPLLKAISIKIVNPTTLVTYVAQQDNGIVTAYWLRKADSCS